MGVYAKDDCLIPEGMAKYIPVQTNREITGEVLIVISDKTILGVVLPKIVYNVKKKLGCILEGNHNPESVLLKRGQTMGLVTPWLVTQEKQGQALVERCEAT